MEKIDFNKSADEVIAEARQRINNLLRLFKEQTKFERLQVAGSYDAAAAFNPNQCTPIARPRSQRGRSPPRSGGSSPLSTYSGLPGSPLSYMDSPQSSRGRSPGSSPFSTYSRPPGSPMSYMSSPLAGSPMSTYSQLPGSPMSYMSSPESPLSVYSQLPGSPLSYMTSPEASPQFQPFPRSPLTASPPPSPYSSPTTVSPASAYSSPGAAAASFHESPASALSAPGGYPGWDVLNSPDRMERMVEETKQAIKEFRDRLDEIYKIAQVQPGYTQDAFMETIYESLPFDNPWPYY